LVKLNKTPFHLSETKKNIKNTQGAFDGYHDLRQGTCNDIDTISVLQLGEVVGGKAVEGKGIGRMVQNANWGCTSYDSYNIYSYQLSVEVYI